MHFGRRPYVYSYLKNILGFYFLFLFQRDIRLRHGSMLGTQRERKFFFKTELFSKRNMEFLWSTTFLTTAGTLLAHFLSLFQKKRKKRKIETKQKQTNHEIQSRQTANYLRC